MLGLDAVDTETGRTRLKLIDGEAHVLGRPRPAWRAEGAPMPIHEKSLIRPENLVTHEHLELDGIDVSGHWSTFIESRAVTDYNESLQEEIAALPGGEYIHRCWQCGSCTNACTVNAINPDFNPRYWIYLIRLGMEEELLRDKDIIWQCVSCNKCTYACPRDVVPEGVMKATAHWLELKGTRRGEAVDDLRRGLLRAGLRHRQDRGRARAAALLQAHRPAAVPGLAGGADPRPGAAPAGRHADEDGPRHALPPAHPRLGPGARAAIDEYVEEREAADRAALGLDAEGAE